MLEKQAGWRRVACWHSNSVGLLEVQSRLGTGTYANHGSFEVDVHLTIHQAWVRRARWSASPVGSAFYTHLSSGIWDSRCFTVAWYRNGEAAPSCPRCSVIYIYIHSCAPGIKIAPRVFVDVKLHLSCNRRWRPVRSLSPQPCWVHALLDPERLRERALYGRHGRNSRTERTDNDST